MGADFKKGARLRRGLCRRVVTVKVDGPLGRRLWPPIGGGLCSLRSGGDSGSAAEGCGLPLCGNAYKVSVTGLTFSVIRQNSHSADWLAALATPYPAVPDFPLFRGKNKTPRDKLLIIPLEMIMRGVIYCY